jgi:hypothetical protein
MKMTRKLIITAVAIFLFGTQFTAEAQDKKNSYEQFEDAKIYFEQNATDGDAEVVIKAKAGDNGMTKLKVVAPDGRVVVDFEALDASTMGIRSFLMESPEPEKIKLIKKAYPEGIYKFSGTTTDGKNYMAEAVLSHVLPSVVKLEHPADEAENVSISGLEIKWSPVEGAEAYFVEVESDESDAKVEAQLLDSETSFFVPEKFLLPGIEYKIVIGAESAMGNLNFVEISFSTAEK